MFAKVFAQIFDSSIAEDYRVRLVFEDFLKLADKDGIVDMTPESISRRTNVPLEIVAHGITELEKPDNKSRSKELEGRRIIRLDDHRAWGWKIVNHAKYRLSATKEMLRMSEADRKKAWRQKKGLCPGHNQDKPGHARDQSASASASASASESVQEVIDLNYYHKDSKPVLDYLNERCGKKYRPTDVNLGFISERLKEPEVTFDGVKLMVDRQCKLWMGSVESKYLRPETLFNKTKFDCYYADRSEPIYEGAIKKPAYRSTITGNY